MMLSCAKHEDSSPTKTQAYLELDISGKRLVSEERQHAAAELLVVLTVHERDVHVAHDLLGLRVHRQLRGDSESARGCARIGETHNQLVRRALKQTADRRSLVDIHAEQTEQRESRLAALVEHGVPELGR